MRIQCARLMTVVVIDGKETLVAEMLWGRQSKRNEPGG